MSGGKLNNRRKMSQALSRVANASVVETLKNQKELPKETLYRIGITGAPGSGKSTIISNLVSKRVDNGSRAAVLAIDPSSPLTKGSILGDRIRMDSVSNDPNVFIRSIPRRRSHDGLADNTADLLWEMEGYEFDEVILETVGVGQAEYSVRALVDTVILVLLPESGDAVQAMKSGILEMADIYVINKSDLPGAELIAAEINEIVSRNTYSSNEWKPCVLSTSNHSVESFNALDEAIDEHREWIKKSIDKEHERRSRVRYQVQSLINRRAEELLELMSLKEFDGRPKEVYEKLIKKLLIK